MLACTKMNMAFFILFVFDFLDTQLVILCYEIPFCVGLFQIAKPYFEAMTTVGELKLPATNFEFFFKICNIRLESNEINTWGLKVAFLSKMFIHVQEMLLF